MTFDKSKFAKPAGTVNAPAKSAAKDPGFFDGVDRERPRFPFLPFGRCEVEIVETARVRGPTFVANMTLLSAEDSSAKLGETYSLVQSMKDEFGKGKRKVFSFVCGAVGADDDGVEAIKQEAREQKSIVDACCGAAGTEYGDNPLAGRKLQLLVSRGGEDGKGDFYRNVEVLASA